MVRAPGVATLRSVLLRRRSGRGRRQRGGRLEIGGVVVAVGEHDRILARRRRARETPARSPPMAPESARTARKVSPVRVKMRV